MFGPALIINPASGVFIADLFAFLLSLPFALFLSFWMSAVKRRWVVILGALVGAFLGFLVILGWVGTLIFDTELADVNIPAVLFGSLFICSVLGFSVAIIADLVLARLNRQDYRRPVLHE